MKLQPLSTKPLKGLTAVFKMLFKGKKKGSATVEAAMVFPLVILAVISLIYILIFFYQVTETNVKMHLALRAESGRLSKTLDYGEHPDAPYPIYRNAESVCYKGNLNFLERGLLKSLHKEISASKYVDDERAFIRLIEQGTH